METPLTLQQVFDRVARHLLAQNARSQDAACICLYRDEQGRSCAVGVLIPDDAYSPCLEGSQPWYGRTGSGELWDALAEGGVCRTRAMSDLLRDLQAAHDTEDPECWRDGLREVAEMHRLSAAVLEVPE